MASRVAPGRGALHCSATVSPRRLASGPPRACAPGTRPGYAPAAPERRQAALRRGERMTVCMIKLSTPDRSRTDTWTLLRGSPLPLGYGGGPIVTAAWLRVIGRVLEIAYIAQANAIASPRTRP